MDYVPPGELLQASLTAASQKAQLSIRDMLLLRGFLAGAILAYATSLAFVVLSQGLTPIIAAILFPVGFVILVLLGLELATGNFALLPAGLAAGSVPFSKLLRNWGWVYAGNLAGSLFYAVPFYLVVTNFNTGPSGSLGELFKAAAQKKTVAYMSLGFRGWETPSTLPWPFSRACGSACENRKPIRATLGSRVINRAIRDSSCKFNRWRACHEL